MSKSTSNSKSKRGKRRRGGKLTNGFLAIHEKQRNPAPSPPAALLHQDDAGRLATQAKAEVQAIPGKLLKRAEHAAAEKANRFKYGFKQGVRQKAVDLLTSPLKRQKTALRTMDNDMAQAYRI